MAEIWRGAPAADAVTEELAERARRLRAKGIEPALAILRVGERPDDVAYERGAVSRCGKAGAAVRRFLLPAGCSREELLDNIQRINEDESIHGCLLLRPLPNKEDEWRACELLAPEKDVDCITPGALGAVFSGRGAGYPPCTAQACIELLDHYGVSLKGKRVTVIGRSLVVGRPLSMLLQRRDATVTMCHTGTVDMPDACRNAEILIAAAGRAGLVDERFVTAGQIVLDVGINVDGKGRLCGDVAFDAVEHIVGAVTPVPGGVGSVTTTVLAKHVIEAAEKAEMRK